MFAEMLINGVDINVYNARLQTYSVSGTTVTNNQSTVNTLLRMPSLFSTTLGTRSLTITLTFRPSQHGSDSRGMNIAEKLATAAENIAALAVPERSYTAKVIDLAKLFPEASSNYGIGYDGKIGLYVDEKNASWCSSSYSNDNRAVTIEVASDTYAPYTVTDKAYNALIKLVADICKRNGIKKLVWSTDKNTRINHRNGCNMTVHRDYANKSCPGDYLYNRMGDIASKVNKKLGSNTTNSESEENTMEAKLNDKNNFVWVIKKDLLLLKKLGVITQGVDDNGSFGNGTLEAIKTALWNTLSTRLFSFKLQKHFCKNIHFMLSYVFLF